MLYYNAVSTPPKALAHPSLILALNSNPHTQTLLPSIDIEILLPKVRAHDRPVCELPAGQGGHGLLRRLWLLILDVDLADAVVLAVAR